MSESSKPSKWREDIGRLDSKGSKLKSTTSQMQLEEGNTEQLKEEYREATHKHKEGHPEPLE